jgi:hypothetical protein
VKSAYLSGRSNDWVKTTCAQRETLTIAGFALDDTKWDGIYVGHRKGKDLVYAGKVDHGFDAASAKDLQARLKPLIRKTQPYAKRIAHKGHLGGARVAGGDRVPGEVGRRQGAAPVLQGATGRPLITSGAITSGASEGRASYSSFELKMRR